MTADRSRGAGSIEEATSPVTMSWTASGGSTAYYWAIGGVAINPADGSPAPITFTGTELLGRPTNASISIKVVPDDAISLRYQYGTTSGGPYTDTATVSATGGQPNTVVIDSLSANTEYFYRMQYSTDGGATWVTRPEHSFWTQRAEGETFTFTITSDGHVNIVMGDPDTWQDTMNDVASEDPDFSIDLGDTIAVRSVSAGDVAGAEGVYEDVLPYFNTVSASSPIFLVPGNHEQQEAWHLLSPLSTSLPVMGTNAQKKYFLNPVPDSFYTGDTSTYSYLSGDQLKEDYYAWTWGDALIVVVSPFWYTTTKPYVSDPGGGESDTTGSGDSWDWTLGQDQYNWLQTTLENSDAKYKFVLAHLMAGGGNISGQADYGHGGANHAHRCEWGGYNEDDTTWGWDTERAGWGSLPVHQMMVANDVTAFFHGHDHQYAYEMKDGIVYQSVPAAGFDGAFDIYTSGDGYTIWADEAEASGHLKVTVGPTQSSVDYIETGAASSTYSYTMAPSGDVPGFVTLDGAASSGTADDVSSINVAHTTGTGTDRLMMVGVSWNCGTTDRSITSVTFTPSGGSAIALSEVITQQGTNSSGDPRYSAIYSLLNPPSGVSGTVTVTFSGSVSNGIVAGAANFKGVDQSTPLGTPDGDSLTSGTAPSLTFTGLNGNELVFDNVFQGASGETQTLTAGAGQTQLWNQWIANLRAAASTEQATGSSVTMSSTAGSASVWAITAVPINPAPIGPTTLTVTSPNGSESWANGEVHNLTWSLSSAVDVGEFQVWLVDGAGNWVSTVGGVAAQTGLTSYSVPWTVSAPARTDYRMDVLYRTNTGAWVFQAWDLSDAEFAITGTSAPVVTVTSPNGSESWANGEVHNLTWSLSSAVDVGEFQVWLVDGAGNWVSTVGGVAAQTGLTSYSVPWTVSAPARTDYRMDVLYRTDTGAWVFQAWDLSDAEFAITGTSAPVVTVTSPNGSESWANGEVHNLTWSLSSAVDVGEFQVWLVDGAGNWVSTVGGVAAQTGLTSYSVPWTVSAPARTDYRMDVLYRTDTGAWVFQAWDLSDAEFAITGTSAPV